ncbi:uncharacterized protein GGS25DRAFT_291004 [Hypoxylon fragiforme]|uniref:uncharacterized protein n=1 Tax=Hypoxylon fragiforme TaxID=63214 RepID=UPI0020C71656|nr:uncharacterized protein GGS25DRAFT_291004 [Hypoxylon fragiforme]KAI2608798.1 hypothetical protein GGS25DRAFT_291004 [Hypoxylon fragiforme]
MATIARQPFAPLDGPRLQTLTSQKNRQNALSNSPGKRKAAESLDTDDSENVDPQLFSKRSKGSDSSNSSTKDPLAKPSFFLTKSISASNIAVASPPKAATPRSRSHLNPKSPTKLNTGITKSPLSAPAGRSPTRGKKTGILSSRRRTGAYSRVDPPSFGLSSTGTPFSLDAALKGTIPSYASRHHGSSKSVSKAPAPAAATAASPSSVEFGSLHESEMMKSSWFFDIHEDTQEQEMTNLLQHSTCVLDISSDEESESRRQRERAEGKENVPPADDVSQTSSRPRAAAAAAAAAARQAPLSDDEMVFEKERYPLGEMNVREYYSEGYDENSVVLVLDDEESEGQQQGGSNNHNGELPSSAHQLEDPQESAAEEAVVVVAKSVAELMEKTDAPAPGAALLEPLEGTGESFEVWESGSAKDEAETTATETTI